MTTEQIVTVLVALAGSGVLNALLNRRPSRQITADVDKLQADTIEQVREVYDGIIAALRDEIAGNREQMRMLASEHSALRAENGLLRRWMDRVTVFLHHLAVALDGDLATEAQGLLEDHPEAH